MSSKNVSFLATLVVAAISVLIVGCSGPTMPRSQNTISSGDEVRLRELVPLATEKAMEILGRGDLRSVESEGLEISPEQGASLVSMTRELLVSEFGEDGLKYLIEGSATPVVDGTTSQSRSQRTGVQEILYNGQPYDLVFAVDFVQTFWGSWNVAKVNLSNVAGNPIPVPFCGVILSDSVTSEKEKYHRASDPSDSSTYRSAYVELAGHLKEGWFPRITKIHSEHFMVSSVLSGIKGATGGNATWYDAYDSATSWHLSLNWTW